MVIVPRKNVQMRKDKEGCGLPASVWVEQRGG